MNIVDRLDKFTSSELQSMFDRNHPMVYAVNDDLIVNKIQIRSSKAGYRFKIHGVMYTFQHKSTAVTACLTNGRYSGLLVNLDRRLGLLREDVARYRELYNSTTNSFKKDLYQTRYQEAKFRRDELLDKLISLSRAQFDK